MEARRSQALEALAAEFRAAFERGDDDWMKDHTALGEVMTCGTAPDEIARGRDQVFAPEYSTEAVKKLFAEARTEIRFGDVEGYEAGDAGFFVTEERFVFEDGTYVPIRSVGVAARDGDSWTMIGAFTSIVARNDLLAPGSPLTVRD
jgi:hypothetical protein